MKDIETMTVGERFSYESIDIEYLRTLQTLPEWLKKHNRTRAKMRWDLVYSGEHNNVPPGHPIYLYHETNNRRMDDDGIRVIPDPDNLAFHEVEYAKEYRYDPLQSAIGEGERRAAAQNRYYIVWRHDFKELWRPLPWTHQRMKVWEVDYYMRYSHYYQGLDGESFRYPLTPLRLQTRKPKIDPRWREEIITEITQQYERDIAAEKAEYEQRARRLAELATPERHMAVQVIRKRYSDYEPNVALINDWRSAPESNLIEPYRWFYHYATLRDQETDPIFALQQRRR